MEIEELIEKEKRETEISKVLTTDEKYNKLKKEHREDIDIYIDNLYSEKYNVREKHKIVHWLSVGKLYDHNTVVKNYVEWISDIVNSFGLTVKDLEGTIPDCFMMETNSFSKSHYNKEHLSTIVQINDNFWISTYNETHKKLEYVRRIKNKLKIGVAVVYTGYKN
jgi:hypothetical protein